MTTSNLTQTVTELTTSTDAPTTAGDAFALENGSITTIDVQAVCAQDGAANTKIFNVRRHIKNVAGTVTATDQEDLTGPEEVGGALAVSVTIGYDAGDLNAVTADVKVTGLAAAECNWRVDCERVQLRAPGFGLPRVASLPHVALPVAENTDDEILIGRMIGMVVNTRIHPAGRPCSWYIQYGTTPAYGSSTDERKLPGKLNAVWHTAFADGGNLSVNGISHSWQAGLGGTELTFEDGFVRWTLPSPQDHVAIDPNHTDGAGSVVLGPYGTLSHWFASNEVSESNGGLRFDMRGAKLSFEVRGTDVAPHGAVLCPWIQFDIDPFFIEGHADQQRPNYAFKYGGNYTDKTLTGEWENVNLTFNSNMNDWQYAGANGLDADEYRYGELDSGLGNMNVDFFLGMFVAVDVTDFPNNIPQGTFDYRNAILYYRNHNCCARQNGGSLISGPTTGSDTAVLTDGWRHGEGHVWQSEASPDLDTPIDFVYAFDNPLIVECIIVANNPACRAKDALVSVSEDGENWVELAFMRGVGAGAQELLENPNWGLNYEIGRWNWNDATPHFQALYPNEETHPGSGPVTHVKVSIISKWSNVSADPVGLGAIEVYGQGSVEETDNDWYYASRDLELAPATTYHYRVVATTDRGIACGPDQTITVP
jgi:hypothetical protein